MEQNNIPSGLSDQEVEQSHRQHGSNNLDPVQNRVGLQVLREVATEPMFVLLLLACSIYFLVGQTQEGIIMLVSLMLVAGISFFQDYRSRNAIKALHKLSAEKATVRRNGEWQTIASDDVVVGDMLWLEEGEIVAADGAITSASDFLLNESILTGEAFPVRKTAGNDQMVYRGTLVISGSAWVQVAQVGKSTQFGKIGLSLSEIRIPKTPLQQQIRSFVRNMVRVGLLAFVVVVGINYWQSRDAVTSLLQGLTLAMSILPEEIPVAFSTFQALGAFRLLRQGVIVKQPQYVETLGSATVICTDKTGTLTENKMSIEYLFDCESGESVKLTETHKLNKRLLEFAMWASESQPFDPMEISIHDAYTKYAGNDLRPLANKIHEYPIAGRPPMMTHIFRMPDGKILIAAKGAPEAIWHLSALPDDMKVKLEAQSSAYAREGYRVLGVGEGHWDKDEWPELQQEIPFSMLGLVAFQDPPKENMQLTMARFQQAGIQVKMITGDYAETALAIARQVGLTHEGQVMTGEDVLHAKPGALREKVNQVQIFARMFPEAKLKVVDALKENGEVVAMTGDGVNDGPALKAAHIGIAMGKRGSDVARNAASLILADDDLSHMTDAVALGRKIYDNLKKAIQYIVSIHIPIILVVLLPLVLAWDIQDIFSPVHVIFLELIMGPTCSIIYENEPMEPGTMQKPPRKMSATFLSWQQLSVSVIQGIAITAACLVPPYYYMMQGHDAATVRSIIFITLLFSNIFLTLINRSFFFSAWQTMQYKNNLVRIIILVTLGFIAACWQVEWLREIFRLNKLSWQELGGCAAAAFIGTAWMEWVKFARRLSQRSPH